MIGITRLYCGTATPGDTLRYGRQTSKLPAHLLHYSEDKKPIVVWNYTRRCNLRCIHCYSDSHEQDYPGELTTEEGKRFLDDVAEFQSPTVLFSGGEPFTRGDLFDLASYGIAQGLRCVISTNGTLIDAATARQIKETGFSYVGVSLDGMQKTNDKFRGKKGAFEEALQGIRNCREAGVRVGLRFTITKYNFRELPEILDLLESENIPRCCFYHLAYAGRGGKLSKSDLAPEETRWAVDLILDRTMDFHKRGIEKDILTVDNHTDGVYLYMRLLQENPERAEEVYQMLRWNGGNQSGIAIADVDNLGNVHADQFWQHYSFGNVKERKIGDIWTDTSDPLMAGLKNRKPLLEGRCAVCKYLDICNGNLRVRAEAATGNPWAPDPACYLTDAEIGIA
ncbi:MAG: radical SAM protein [Armatimonadetes bacterium]|nr:radical SAM protein [Armatimonadota bacterium]